MKLAIIGAEKLIGLNYHHHKPIPIMLENKKIGEAKPDKTCPDNIHLDFDSPLPLTGDESHIGILEFYLEGKKLHPQIILKCKEENA